MHCEIRNISSMVMLYRLAICSNVWTVSIYRITKFSFFVGEFPANSFVCTLWRYIVSNEVLQQRHCSDANTLSVGVLPCCMRQK
jgi:hypothetical protein